jgi:hypothetical protein
MKFGGQDISRLVCGVNPFVGISHFNQQLNTCMREYYTVERIVDVMHQCNRFGINAYNYRHNDMGYTSLQRFEAEGGKMHLIVQEWGDPLAVGKAVKPLAMHYMGEFVDRAFQDDDMDSVKEWCKKCRDTGALVGIGTHKPEVIDWVEQHGWDVDFYAGCVYNRTRTVDEWKKILNGDIMELPGEIYLASDPPKMYKAMRSTKKPCFAFKILAAGRLSVSRAPAAAAPAPTSSTAAAQNPNAARFPNQGGQALSVDMAFQTAFQSIKPIDGAFVGLFPKTRDEVRECAAHMVRVLGAKA